MSWAKEMKNLVAGIKAGREGRAQLVKSIRKDVKDFLAKSEENRKKDFSSMMKGIKDGIGLIRKDTHKLLGDARKLLGEYKEERKDAASYWNSLLKKGPAGKLAAEKE